MDNFQLYEQDFYGWTQLQAHALNCQRVSALDWQHLKEEIEALGKQQYRELVSRFAVLLFLFHVVALILIGPI